MSYLQSTNWLEPVGRVALLLTSVLVLYCIGTAVYNIFLHPLRSYPGPLLWRMSWIPWEYQMFRGTLHTALFKLHKQYGDSVRVAPDEISYTNSQALKDIFSHIPGKEEFSKQQLTLPPNGIPSILAANKENHARYRRLLAHAFSEKGLRDQESHIYQYIDLLIDRLGEVAEKGEATDMVAWFNMTTFDVIGDLAFGQSFSALENREVHEWIPATSGSVRFTLISSILGSRGLGFLNKYFVPEETQVQRKRNFMYSQEKVEYRIQHGRDRGDFWDRIIVKSADDNKTGEGMSHGEMLNNAAVLVLGGSETSATTLSGVIFLLLNHPEIMKQLLHEIRSAFQDTTEITLFSVNRLKYTTAVLEETLRIYPPVARLAARVSPKGGRMVNDKYIPEKMIVSAPAYTFQNVESNFHRPHDFVPERWLDDAPAEFANDDKAAWMPFSLGTRNCIGRNLAYAEMRLILAKVLFHFDLSLEAERTGDWFDQKAWALWQKKPLYVKLKPVQR